MNGTLIAVPWNPLLIEIGDLAKRTLDHLLCDLEGFQQIMLWSVSSAVEIGVLRHCSAFFKRVMSACLHPEIVCRNVPDFDMMIAYHTTVL